MGRVNFDLSAERLRLEAEWAQPAINIDVSHIPGFAPGGHELPEGKQANIYNVAYLLLMAGVNPAYRVQLWRHSTLIQVGYIGELAPYYVYEAPGPQGLALRRRKCDLERRWESGAVKLSQEQISTIVSQASVNAGRAAELHDEFAMGRVEF